MNTLLLLIVLLILLAGTGYRFGGPVYGGGIGLVLLILLILWVAGYIR